ncbi:MAG: hypothetical protein ACRCSK_05840 [Fusobacteriaceae bacterium]
MEAKIVIIRISYASFMFELNFNVYFFNNPKIIPKQIKEINPEKLKSAKNITIKVIHIPNG